MKIIFTKSKWEMGNDSLESFLRRAAADHFDAVEIYLPAQPESARELAARVADHGLGLVAQINTEGPDAAAHLDSLERRFAHAAETAPLLVNSHTARDWFSFDDNLRIFSRACELSRASGLPFTHETHRSRPTGSAPETYRYLQALPELRLNADFSHWFCVHESDLSDQPAAVDLAIARASHIHARVGFEEGPQVPDPLHPLWSRWTQLHLALWHRIIADRRAAGAAFLTLTPEFGPPPYMPVDPRTARPLADAWETNVRFRDWLHQNLPA
jgi:sugar phosphate isomerase/epimerase